MCKCIVNWIHWSSDWLIDWLTNLLTDWLNLVIIGELTKSQSSHLGNPDSSLACSLTLAVNGMKWEFLWWLWHRNSTLPIRFMWITTGTWYPGNVLQIEALRHSIQLTVYDLANELCSMLTYRWKIVKHHRRKIVLCQTFSPSSRQNEDMLTALTEQY